MELIDRSKALGAPPRCTCPRMVTRMSSPSCSSSSWRTYSLVIGWLARVVGALGDDHDAVAPAGRAAALDDLAQLPLPARVGRPLGDQHVGGVRRRWRSSAPGSRSAGPSPRPRSCADGSPRWSRSRRSASTMRCSAESAPMVMSVPSMSLSIEPTRPAIISAGCRSAVSRSIVAGGHQLVEQRRPFLAQQVRPGQAAVAADHDQPVDAQLARGCCDRPAPALALAERQPSGRCRSRCRRGSGCR